MPDYVMQMFANFRDGSWMDVIGLRGGTGSLGACPSRRRIWSICSLGRRRVAIISRRFTWDGRRGCRQVAGVTSNRESCETVLTMRVCEAAAARRGHLTRMDRRIGLALADDLVSVLTTPSSCHSSTRPIPTSPTHSRPSDAAPIPSNTRLERAHHSLHHGCRHLPSPAHPGRHLPQAPFSHYRSSLRPLMPSSPPH